MTKTDQKWHCWCNYINQWWGREHSQKQAEKNNTFSIEQQQQRKRSLSETMQARKQGSNIFKGLKIKNKKDYRENIFQKRQHNDFFTHMKAGRTQLSRTTLQKKIKGSPTAEGKWYQMEIKIYIKAEREAEMVIHEQI